MEIFIIREGRQTGPFSDDAVRAFLTEGSVRPTDLGWRKGMADWRAVGEVLKPLSEQPGDLATPPPAGNTGSNGEQEKHVPATAKQKAFLKYLGAEFGENLTKERAALAVSDALETPKLQTRIRKWHDDKLRMHPDLFQDEIDFRRANRSGRYHERIQTEGADVLKDVTKAHVQVLVESLDKRSPGWESDRETALWNHLLPAIGEHFPQLVLPSYKDRLKPGAAPRSGKMTTRGLAAAAGVALPPKATGTFGAMLRGVLLGVIALGAILGGYHFWKQSQTEGAIPAAANPAPPAPEKKQTPAAASELATQEPAAKPPEKLIAEAKAPDAAPENPPPPAPRAPAAPNEAPAPATPPMAAEKPAPPAEKPAVPEEKPAAPASGVPPTTPAAPGTPAAENTPPATPPAPAPRNAVKLTQGIGVMLPNGQVTLPAGTILRYLATEGPNVRVSWNNNVFFVPALATDVNEPLPAPSAPAGTPPAPGAQPAAPATPKKPADDL
ncbi:MAG: DUF4339 domain-containing protein [Chthoniobacteraceae bacterium]